MHITQSFDEIIRYVRNALRPYSAQSIADIALQSFETFRGKGLDELRSAPWITALLVKIVLEDRRISIPAGASCPAPEFDRLRQVLWEVSPIGTGGVHLALRVMFHTQLQFQRPESWSFLRWPALIRELPGQHPTRRQFGAVLGMSPDAFIGLCWGTYAAVLGGKQFIAPAYFESLKPLYGTAVDSFLSLFARDLLDLRTELRLSFDERIAAARRRGDAGLVRDFIEVTEFPWLQKYPLLRHHSGNLAVWHPLILARGMEQAVHTRMSTLGQDYTDAFSLVHEGYVLQLLRDARVAFEDEATFKKRYSRAAPSVEAIIDCEQATVLVESKMSLFPEEVVASDSPEIVFRKLRRIREAIVQAWRVSELRAPEAEQGRPSYLVAVTSRQLNVCSGEQLKRMFGQDVFDDILPESRFGAPSDSQLTRLPPQNMFFLSIEEFEHLTGCIGRGQIELPELLRDAAAAQGSSATSVYHFDQLLIGRTTSWTMPDIQLRARDHVEAQFRQFFGV